MARQLYIYRLTQNENNNYGTCITCIVCAYDEEDAKTITPNDNVFEEGNRFIKSSGWALTKAAIKCELLVVADSTQPRGLVLAAFNPE